MVNAPSKRGSFFQFLLLFAVVYLGSTLLLRMVFPQQFGPNSGKTGLILTPASSSFSIGNHPIFTLSNQTAAEYILPSRCPQPPLDLFLVENPGTPQEKLTPVTSSETTTPCEPVAAIPAGDQVQIPLSPWKYSIFERVGVFEARVPAAAPSGTGSAITGTGAVATQQQLTARVAMVEPGVFTKLFRTFISAPFLNLLILIASIVPNHNLGVSIIILTLIIKLLLFLPTKKALEGQKKMQLLQPKLEALKKLHPNDPQKQQEETMKLWKEHKINPFSACLPTLFQFPILIGLFYVIRDGSHLELSHHLIYPMNQNLSWSFSTNFLGLNLLKPEYYIMPVLLVVLQFLQMKLSFAINARKKAKAQPQAVIDVGTPEKKESSPQDMQQRIMTYGLPLMIGFFALKFPAAVSLYWGVSTLFAIGQQVLVNREHIRP